MDKDILTMQQRRNAPKDGEATQRYPTRDTARAYLLLNSAEAKRKYADEIANRDHIGARMERNDAANMERRALATLELQPGFVERGTGGELTLPPEDRADRLGHLDLVKDPDWVELYASRERIELLSKAQAFNLGADAADSIKAQDSTEKMLAHQMAAAHRAALDLLGKSAEQRNTVEQARLANTAARLMDTYQRAMLTLKRYRSDGRQIVTVQHVKVADGGQAVITGAVHTGGHLAGGEGEK
jgi:hypothetical protein